MKQRRNFLLKEGINVFSVFTDYLALNVQMLDNFIHLINHYSADVLGKPNALSTGWCFIQWIEYYLSFEQLGPGVLCSA